MKTLLGLFMVLMLLLVGAMGFGSINEFETVGTLDALMISAVSVDEVHLLESVAPWEITGLEFNDAQAIVAVAGYTYNDLRMLSSANMLDDMYASLIHATNGLVLRKIYRWGDRNRYILHDPFGGGNLMY